MTFEVMKVRWNLIEPLGVHLADVGQPSMPVVSLPRHRPIIPFLKSWSFPRAKLRYLIVSTLVLVSGSLH